MPIVVAKELTKIYGEFRALDGCNLAIPESNVFGLLGPNGAGKTTLIRSLLGFLKPSSGTATVDGFDCETQSLQVRERTSYLPAETKLFRTMKGSACMEFFSSIHPRGNLTKAKAIAQRLQLDTSRRVGFMSTGMRQKLAISCALSCSSRVVILDEPTANLDPNVRQEVLALVKESQASGATVVFCSHVLSEIEEICDQAAILRKGKVVEVVDLKSMKAVHRVRALKTNPIPKVVYEQCKHVRETSEQIEFEVEGDLAPHLKWMEACGFCNLVMESVGLRSIYDRIHNQ